MAFPTEPTLDLLPIAQVPLNTQGRDEIIPILAALQALYANTTTRDQILAWIAQDVNGQTRATRGRPGLAYWHIVVLAAVRLGCNLDYDKLQNLAEEHRTLRRIMGIGTWDDDADQPERWDWRRLRDNLCLIRPETLERINEAVVRVGHGLEPRAAEHVRGDSFVVETNIHYPTDASVLADGLRKILQLAQRLAAEVHVPGWRQAAHLRKRVKHLVRAINQACRSKKAGAPARRRRAYQPLLKLARKLLRRVRVLLTKAAQAQRRRVATWLDSVTNLVRQLTEYTALTDKVADNARRRVVADEAVPNAEKVFSVFEPHTELINRGKVPHGIQFGRPVLMLEDQVGFVVHYEILSKGQQDKDVAVSALQRAQTKVGGTIRSASFDRAFHTPANQAALADVVEEPCVPARGHKQAARQEAEATPEFRRSRRRHPGVESLIHGLQAGNGLARCRDRTEQGFRRYVGLGVLGRNLHVLGKLVLAQDDAKCRAAQTRRQPQVA